MIEYSQKDIEYAKILKCRFILFELKNQCQSNVYVSYEVGLINDVFHWNILRRSFEDLLFHYDNGGKINEDFLLSLYGIKIAKNIKIINRLIKLIKIV